MAYVKKGPFQNNVAAPPLNAAFFDGLETALVSATQYVAPPPSGGDDTAVLQALVNAAMSSAGVGSGPGEVVLQAGEYRANLTTNPGFWQPVIRGKGLQATRVRAYDGTKPVFTIAGTSGSYTGGRVSDLTVAGADISSTTSYTGTGIELLGACGVEIINVQFINLVTGLKFHNGSPGAFTEFCVARDCSWSYTQLPVQYLTDGGGDSSFHGSGLDGNSHVNLPPGCEFIDISTGARPYNAPLNVTVFTSGTLPGNFIVNRGGASWFHGTLRIEMQSTNGDWAVGWTGGAYVFLVGHVSLNGSPNAPVHLGYLFLCDSVEGTGTLLLPYLKPWRNRQTLTGAATGVMGAPTYGPGAYLGTVTIVGPNSYWYSYTLLMWNSGTSIPATITVLGTHVQNNSSGGPGAPTFTWNNGLVVNNASYGASYTCNAAFTQMTHQNPGDNLGQY